MLLHIALVVIVAGAFITHFTGITGKLTLVENQPAVSEFTVESGPSDGKLPFSVELDKANTIFHTGTTTPKDFSSKVTIIFPDGKKESYEISMNKVATCRSWRFYQTGMGDSASTLSLSHDPWGIAVTYTGYCLLALGMILFFFQRHTAWRAWLRKLTMATVVSAAFLSFGMPAYASDIDDALPTIQRPLAKNLGKIYVYWNDRISPLQTMAKDVTVSLYGSTAYRGYTAEQVLAGWLFNYDAWKRDFDYRNSETPSSAKKRKRLEEKRDLVRWLGTGEAFRIYPYHSANGRMEWLSLSGRKPSKMSLEQWKFMTGAMHGIAMDIAEGKNIRANEGITGLIEGQRKYAGNGNLPSDSRFRAEMVYNSIVRILPVAVLLLIAGLSAVIFTGFMRKRTVRIALVTVCAAALAYILFIAGLRGYAGGHIPLSNGFETMLCMAMISLAGALSAPRKISIIRPGLMIVAGAALCVAAMSEAHPRIGALMPVLDSSLLSIHVMLVMTSYAMFFLMAIVAARSIVGSDESAEEGVALNHVLLVPAVFLLAGGIFVGAVWANQSWGRYWGWDPKETCALVTMLVYALPMHTRSMRFLRKDKVFNIYILLAFLSVIFTYFGANYLFSGLHSYA